MTGGSQADRAPRWLLLIHQIPPKPDYLRVKVRRKLHGIGAVALKNSVYVLPHGEDAMEDFHWVRRLIVSEGGEATVCAATFLDGVDDQGVEAMFRAQADQEYGQIEEGARAALQDPTEADLRRLERGLREAQARDFFRAGGADAAHEAVSQLQATLAGHLEGAPVPGGQAISASPRAVTWVTREGVRVDRVASAWLIRRFIDPEAQFKFVAPADYRPGQGELRFDMFDGEFTHEGEDCTFEVLVKRFIPSDRALQAIAEVVHDVDCKDGKFGRAEAPGIESLIRGIAESHSTDLARVQAGAVLFEGLYASFRRDER